MAKKAVIAGILFLGLAIGGMYFHSISTEAGIYEGMPFVDVAFLYVVYGVIFAILCVFALIVAAFVAAAVTFVVGVVFIGIPMIAFKKATS